MSLTVSITCSTAALPWFPHRGHVCVFMNIQIVCTIVHVCMHTQHLLLWVWLAVCVCVWMRCHCLASGGFIKAQCPEVKSHSSPLLWSGSSGLAPPFSHVFLHPQLSFFSLLPSVFPPFLSFFFYPQSFFLLSLSFNLPPFHFLLWLSCKKKSNFVSHECTLKKRKRKRRSDEKGESVWCLSDGLSCLMNPSAMRSAHLLLFRLFF